MLTIHFDNDARIPLYEQLYRRIRSSIESGDLKRNEKLPSKRHLSQHLQISVFTVQNAYAQLLEEGYITSEEKKGYYVCAEPVAGAKKVSPALPPPAASEPPPCAYDLRTNAVDTEHFPYSVWSRLMRRSMRDNPAILLNSTHPQGNQDLRIDIAHYLRSFRDVDVSPEQIVLGAGIEYIIGLMTELLPTSTFGYENPGYQKIRKILKSRRADMIPIRVDNGGISVKHLSATTATTVFVTPSNHFPTGAVMDVGRRRQLIEWAEQKEERYIIEDDFNSEFRFVLKPIPALQSLDREGKVIYINSFAQTLAPSLRIAYAVLPETLLKRYHESLMFYSCTVSQFEQLTLKWFLQDGYYERHVSRMKMVYRSRQNALVDSLSPIKDNFTIDGLKAGLHVRLTSPRKTEQELVQAAYEKGVRVYPFSDYYASPPPETHTVVLGYAAYSPDELHQIAALLCEAWGD